MLARVVAVLGVGPVVIGNRQITISGRTSYTIVDNDGKVYDGIDAGPSQVLGGPYRRTRQPVPLASMPQGMFRCQCPCTPEPIPEQWIRARLAYGARDVEWDWKRYAAGNNAPS